MNCKVPITQLQTVIYLWPFLLISIKNFLDCVESVALFGEKFHLNSTESSNPRTQYLSPSTYVDII